MLDRTQWFLAGMSIALSLQLSQPVAAAAPCPLPPAPCPLLYLPTAGARYPKPPMYGQLRSDSSGLPRLPNEEKATKEEIFRHR